jgi:hypothetical protein
MILSRKLLLVASTAAFLMGASRLWPDETRDEVAPSKITDYGRGPGRPAVLFKHMAASVPVGTPTASVTGMFGAPVAWPIEPIHMALLPDGRVMSFGSTTTGKLGASLSYDVWTPTVGTGTDAHMVLPNTTATNIFCGASALIAGTGDLLVVGGSLKSETSKGFSGLKNVTAFEPAANAIVNAPAMVYARWYPTMVPLPGGQVYVAGGLQDGPLSWATTPELYDPANGWRALPNAASTAAFGATGNWYYPRIFMQPSGSLIDLGNDGEFYAVDPAGMAPTTALKGGLAKGSHESPDAMFAPGLILSLRFGTVAQVVDLTGATPIAKDTAPIDQRRAWANMTVLADGTVLVTGGSAVANELVGVDTTAQIWHPSTGTWTAAASAAIPRLYHSAALLLPDGTVLTGGGGDPGPIRNMNAEIFYPPYLYGQTGVPAVQPVIDEAPSTAHIGGTLSLAVDPSDTITKVTMLRAGAVTHSENLEQRFFNLPFVQSGQTVTASLPSNGNLFAPGFYMVFVLQNGVPSVASLISVS